MVYGVLRLINFAHGDFYMVAAYISYSILGAVAVNNSASWGQVVVVGVVTMVASGGLAVLVERLVYRLMIAALGISEVLENGVLVLPFWGSSYRAYPVPPATSGFEFNTVHYSFLQVGIVAVAVVLTLGVYWLINRTLLGTAMRAVAQDRTAASLMGIDPNRVIAIVFFIGGALAGAAAVMGGLYYGQISYLMGFSIGLQAFTAAVLGGIGNVLGAVVGGFILGILESVGTGLFGSEWALLFAFLALILTLWLRPTGLLGERTGLRV
jgi:branched-chain amino acid transport system permease protein